MNSIAAPSVSLEGSGIDVIRSLPVPTRTVLLAKAGNHLLFTLPAILLTSLLSSIALRSTLTAAGFVLVFLLPAICTVFDSLYDLTMNLLMPNLHWANEITVVKQSLASFVSMMTGMILPPLLLLGAIFLPIPPIATGIIYTGIFLAASVALYFTVTRWGARVFEKLS